MFLGLREFRKKWSNPYVIWCQKVLLTPTSYDDMPNGYQETIKKGMNAVRYFTTSMSYGKGNKDEQISRLKTEIKEADAIVIGAGA